MPKTIYIGGVQMNTVDDVLGTYRPDPRRIPPEMWEQTRDIARLAVRRGGADTPSGAIDDLRAITGQLEWGLKHGYGTDLAILLTPDLVESYFEHLWREKVRTNTLLGTTANTYRSRLRRLGRVLNAGAWPPEPRPGSRATLIPPYTGAEIRLLLQQAAKQKTRALSDAMTTIICLGVGAGMTAAEMMAATEDDLDWDADDRLLIHVRGDGKATTPVTPRTVPILTGLGLAGRLQSVAAQTSPMLVDRLGKARHDPFGNMVERFNIPQGVPRLNTRRLRNTWLECLLVTRGLLVSDIMRMAGLTTAKSIEDIAQSFLPADDAIAVAATAGWWLEQ